MLSLGIVVSKNHWHYENITKTFLLVNKIPSFDIDILSSKLIQNITSYSKHGIQNISLRNLNLNNMLYLLL